MPPEVTPELVEVLSKIPLFTGLSLPQVRRILNVCARRTHEPEERLCIGGNPSDEMYIVISGELAIVTEEGVRVATIHPVTTVGEMGVITGQPRSATVEVIKQSVVLVIQKRHFDALMRAEESTKAKIYKNVIEILSEKLVSDNMRLRDYAVEKAHQDAMVRSKNRKIEIALDLLVEQGVEREAAEATVDARLNEIPPMVLVADDEVEFRRLVKLALPGYNVAEATNGKMALETVAEELPDVVIADIRMPEMDGTELLARLRELHPDLPVLAVSGYMEASELEEYGFDGVIEKPVIIEELNRSIEQVLDKSKSQKLSSHEQGGAL